MRSYGKRAQSILAAFLRQDTLVHLWSEDCVGIATTSTIRHPLTSYDAAIALLHIVPTNTLTYRPYDFHSLPVHLIYAFRVSTSPIEVRYTLT